MTEPDNGPDAVAVALDALADSTQRLLTITSGTSTERRTQIMTEHGDVVAALIAAAEARGRASADARIHDLETLVREAAKELAVAADALGEVGYTAEATRLDDGAARLSAAVTP